VIEQGGLEARPVGRDAAGRVLRLGLDDEVHLDRAVRPAAHVHLLSGAARAETRAVSVRNGPSALASSTVIGEVLDVAGRLHDQRAEPERADAVLHPPAVHGVDQPTREWPATVAEVTRQEPARPRGYVPAPLQQLKTATTAAKARSDLLVGGGTAEGSMAKRNWSLFATRVPSAPW
jgi:hypothetical protein